MKPKHTSVILLSGGINSTAAAARALEAANPHFLYVNHGHAAAESEIEAVRELSLAMAAKLHIVKVPSITELAAVEANPGAPATATPTAPTATTSARHVTGFMLTMLGVALQLARQIKACNIVCGVSQVADELESGSEPGQGDPQARHTFFHAAATAIEMSTSRKRTIQLDTPFIDFSRPDIIQVGLRMGAPFHLTWSCHQSGKNPCSQCQGCAARSAAFDAVGQEDPALQTAR
ncbi:MAG: 7-cyano-7-deazaguanine synthase [Phycisphaerae bacterium]